MELQPRELVKVIDLEKQPLNNEINYLKQELKNEKNRLRVLESSNEKNQDKLNQADTILADILGRVNSEQVLKADLIEALKGSYKIISQIRLEDNLPF